MVEETPQAGAQLSKESLIVQAFQRSTYNWPSDVWPSDLEGHQQLLLLAAC